MDKMNTLTPTLNHVTDNRFEEKLYQVEVGTITDTEETHTFATVVGLGNVIKKAEQNNVALCELGSPEQNIIFKKKDEKSIHCYSPVSRVSPDKCTEIVKETVRKLFTAANLQDEFEIIMDSHN